MRIEVPSYYKAEFVRGKKRTTESAYLSTIIELDLREVDEVEAPIAHIIGEHRAASDTLHVPFAAIDGAPVEVRLIDGLHYVKTARVDDLDRLCSSDGDDNPFNGFHHNPDGGYCTAGYRDTGDVFPSRAAFEASQKETMRKWEDLRHITVGAMTRRADQLAVVDGWVYEQVREPALTLVVEANSITLRITEVEFLRNVPFNRKAGYYKPATCIRFGIDELERAESVGKELAEKRVAFFNNRVSVGLVSPWHVRFRGESELLYSRSLDIVRRLQGHIMDFQPGFAKAWYDLATAVHEHNGITKNALDAVRRLCAMAEHLEGSFVDAGFAQSHSRIDLNTLKSAMNELAEALDLWDSRDPQGIEWFDESLGGTASFDEKVKACELISTMDVDSVSLKTGIDMAHMVEDAMHGKGSIILIEEAHKPKAVCFARVEDGDVVIVETRTANGAPLSQRYQDLAYGHVVKAVMSSSATVVLDAYGL